MARLKSLRHLNPKPPSIVDLRSFSFLTQPLKMNISRFFVNKYPKCII
ncbi:hypothetical protein MtrunA17_Chr5g0437171 [Medicago truncatula]|uniref:Uncharacterized protein n=1 Tax=Medicago truncatula TaxID=3880 RepID=A0A396HUW9_MEDTR|nr:hypothetical protein MtrunA17_Chr5g0437171 [Medicago truncatula]